MNYNADDIVSLSAGEGFRTKLGMYLSADLQQALVLGLRELIYNSQDEYEQGYGDTIKITIDTVNNIMSCEDNARGIPVGMRKDGVNSLIAAFTIPHSGAKHELGVYAGAVGINGEGCKILCHTAKWMDVTVWRDKKIYSVHFESDSHGAHTKGVVEAVGSDKTGTLVRYQPDPEVYKDAKIDVDEVRKTLQELSYFTKGLKFLLKVDGKKDEVFYSPNGLTDALKNKERIHTHVLSYYNEIDDVKVEFALQWSKKPELKAFANNLYMPDGGAFMTGFKTSLTKAFNSGCDKNFNGDILRKYLDGFISVKVKVPSYSNQAKTSLANPEARTAVSKATTEAIKDFILKYPQDIEQILKVVEAEQKAEAAAQRARDSINKVMTGDKNLKYKDKAKKLRDCSEPHGELFLVEGE